MVGEPEALLAKHQRDLKIQRFLFVIAALSSLWMLHIRPDAMGNDFSGHKAYLQHLQNNPFDPFAYTNHESWHPPTYYYIAGVAAKIGEALGWSAVKGARLISAILYLIYIYFGFLSLRLFLSGWALVASSVLLIAWPSNLELATRVNSDAAIYPIYAATQYYVMRAFLSDRFNDCMRALAISFVGLAFKSSALVPVSIAAVATGCWLIINCRSWRHRKFISRRTICALVGLFCIGVSINASRFISAKFLGTPISPFYLGGVRTEVFSFFDLLALRPYRLIETPFSQPPFIGSSVMEFALRTAVFTEYPFFTQYRVLAQVLIAGIVLQLVTIAIYLISLVPAVIRWLRSRCVRACASAASSEDLACHRGDSGAADQECLGVLILLMLVSIAVGSLLVFTLLRHWIVCANYRFVQPSIIAWIALVFLPLQGSWRRSKRGAGLWMLWYLGATVLTLVALAIFLLKISLLVSG